MALDIYVGTLTRYYRHDWENAGQRLAREQGLRYHTISAGGTPEEPPPASEIRKSVGEWCHVLTDALRGHLKAPIKWNESDDMPYFTERPGWDCYSAMLTLVAHAEHPDLPLPEQTPQSWVEDEAFQRSTAAGFKSRYRTILEPQLWIPAEFPGVIYGPTLASERSAIGSAVTLKRQLDELCERSVNQRNELQAGNPSSRWALFKWLAPGVRKGRRGGDSSLIESAAVGLEIFSRLTVEACTHSLPMLLDF